MAMAPEINDTDHLAHHPDITTECPVTCLGVRTVGDLVNFLATARTALPDADPTTSPDETALTEPAQHNEHTTRCPLSCLDLSARVLNPLRYNTTTPQTIGALIRMIQTGQLAQVHRIGRRSLTEIRTALVAAGFDTRNIKLP
ncbi:DNA-directed RNA polymerase subunit alpha C-terminal domain-containing protein [Actinomadura spongiicola]|nr:DNA-directed RNA polymerase subunit alpha C-terminal domain-containing protein [Actinomadura spongiicola]